MKKQGNAVLTAALLLGAAASGAALADEPAAAPAKPTAPAGPTLKDLLTASGIDMHGYVDTAFSWLSGAGLFTSGAADRVFDTEPNSFNVHQAALIVDYQPKEGFGALVNLTAGRDARIIQSVGESSSNFDVTQAFVQFAHNPITIIGGKYVTLAGAEVINSTADTNYSRSILFGYAIPFSHTGVRLTYAASDQVSLIVGLNNGWDQLQDTNKQKTAELGVAFTPNKICSLAVQGYSGTENTSSGHSGRRDLIDAVGTWNATSQLTLILNVDWGDQDSAASLLNGTLSKAKWDGAAAYANYQFNDHWAVSVRAEYFDDKDGYRTGVIQKWKEGTATLRYMPNTNFEVRAEGRYDKTDGSDFIDNALAFTTSAGATGTKDTGYSLGLEAIAKF
ncbi:MAG: outer membrane beta-barrel protein [Steroidobacteraceae bacterium]